jgi:hypothetical protein
MGKEGNRMDNERVDYALFMAGKQWGAKTPAEIISALDMAGYVIVPKEPTEAMCAAGAKYYHDNWRPGHAKEDTGMALIWKEMIGVLR